MAIHVNMPLPVQSILVYRADAFCAIEGVNLGDPVSVLEDLVPDDIYALCPDAERYRLALHMHGDDGLEIATATQIGTAGARLHLDCALLLMSPDGTTTDAIVLVETDTANHIADIYLLPLAPLDPTASYRIVKMERASARKKFAQVACVSFSRGTRITMASGKQVPIEKLRV